MTKRDPSRSSGWFSGWPEASKSVTPSVKPLAAPAYSYSKDSPGYTQHTFAQAQKVLVRIGAEFSDLFNEDPDTDKKRAAREYFLKLDQNERAALKEMHDSMASKQGCF